MDRTFEREKGKRVFRTPVFLFLPSRLGGSGLIEQKEITVSFSFFPFSFLTEEGPSHEQHDGARSVAQGSWPRTTGSGTSQVAHQTLGQYQCGWGGARACHINHIALSLSLSLPLTT